MRLWIVIGCAVLIVGAALWPFGRRTEQLGTVPVSSSVATKPPEAAKPEPAKIVEVIDLARAYEPVREAEEPAGAINPASFIQVPDGPRQIPAALAWDDMPERIDVMPREVIPIGNGLLNFAPAPKVYGELVFVPMGVPYAVEITQPIPPNASIQNGLLNFTPTDPMPPTEALKVMPRQVPEVKIKREEKERRTGVREDDYTGLIGP